jgi:hypothetical protein
VASAAPSVPAPLAPPASSALEEPTAPPPIVADNKVKPLSGEAELQARAKLLLEAITKNDPAIAEPFWFPREAFLVLKDIKDPGKYWGQLHRTYASDIAKLHKKRASWEGVTFDQFEIGSAPKWVKPGEEGNKIGYYRSFRGKIHYKVGDKPASIEVHTVITWQGRWYITHLSKFKK